MNFDPQWAEYAADIATLDRLGVRLNSDSRAGSITVAWILKAQREGRPLADVMREHGEAGSPALDSGHPFWAGCETPDRLPSLDDLQELQAATAQLAAERNAGPQIVTCQDCRATYETGTKCEPCAQDAQAAPGQPIPKDMEPSGSDSET